MGNSRRIGVFGAGWVGLVTGGCFAELGHDVVVRDVVPERIDALRRGQLPFHEPELPEVLARNAGRLAYTDWNELTFGTKIYEQLLQGPPFTLQCDHAERQRSPRGRASLA